MEYLLIPLAISGVIYTYRIFARAVADKESEEATRLLKTILEKKINETTP